MQEKVGVVLLNLGGPDSLDAVEPFLYNLFVDPDIINFPGSFLVRKPLARLISSKRHPRIQEQYKKIGGKSPLKEFTLGQAALLEKELNKKFPARVFAAMRYWHPFTAEVLDEIEKEGIKKVILLPLYPQYSKATTESSVKEWKTAPQTLYRDVRAVLESARSSAYRSVNTAMVLAYWHVGRLIVEHEQEGRSRAGYGEALIVKLASRLTRDLGRGFDERNLWYMRSFFEAFPIVNALRSQSPKPAPRSTARKGAVRLHDDLPTVPSLRPELSWTHYRLLLRVEDSRAREWYLHEAADQHWSSRQLERQISVLYYERLLTSRKKDPVRKEARGKLATVTPEVFIRDPYVLEFLELKDYPGLRESAVEQTIVDNLQSFLLELGKGFSFVSRQKRMRFDDEDFYVDLVFYNYLLRCFVLVDLKVGKLTHQDIGQMDAYVRMYHGHARGPGDNPTIGLILCSRKNEAIAKYSVLGEGRQIFAAKYVQVLPSEGELKREIERGRRLVDGRRGHRGPR